MIISRTPYRISFFGGGTDYPDYFLKYGGKVIGTTIDKYCYLSVRKLPPFFDFKHRIVYSSQESVQSVDEIKHPSVRETFRFLKINEGKTVLHDGDIPARSGMGSSSSFTVGLLKSLMALRGKVISKELLAKYAIHIEQNLIKENVGSQDQVCAAFGGLNLIEFLKNGEFTVTPVIMPPDRLIDFEKKFMLFFTGISRFASNIAEEQVKNTVRNLDTLHSMKDLVDEAYSILIDEKRPLADFGRLLNKTWALKKTLSSKISNQHIEDMYKMAIDAGAVGGKLLGAGGGGFMLLYADPENQPKIKSVLKEYLYIPFKFDFEGSTIIVYEPNYRNSYR